MKECTRCNESKPLDQFHNCKSKTDGKFSACKLCRNTYNKEKAASIGHDVLYQRATMAEGYKEKRAKYYQDNAESKKAYAKRWKAENSEKSKEARRADYQKNKERYKLRAKQWSEQNREKRKEIASNYAFKVYHDPAMKPVLTARKLLSRVLEATGKKKAGKTFSVLGYNRDSFEKHIEKQFQDGMNWSNHGDWHVDHIISVSEMIGLGITDPSIINALSNLRPMWARDNQSKGAGFDLSILVSN